MCIQQPSPQFRAKHYIRLAIMKILVTGAAGFVGTAFIQMALKSGAEVVGYDIDDRFQRLSRSGIDRNARFRFCRMDLSKNTPSVDGDFSYIVHLAALAHVDYSMLFPEESLRNNVTSTINMLGLARSKALPLLFASSVEVYGNTHGNTAVNEEYSRTGMSPYALSKILCEDICVYYKQKHELDITIVRFTNLFGPWQSPDRVIPRSVLRMQDNFGVRVDLGRVRDFLYVDDAVEAIWRAINEKTEIGIFNVSTGFDREISEVILWIKDYMQSSNALAIEVPSEKDGRGLRLVASPERARVVLGWAPQCDFHEALKQTVDWYLANQDWANQFRGMVWEADRSKYLIDRPPL